MDPVTLEHFVRYCAIADVRNLRRLNAKWGANDFIQESVFVYGEVLSFSVHCLHPKQVVSLVDPICFKPEFNTTFFDPALWFRNRLRYVMMGPDSFVVIFARKSIVKYLHIFYQT